MNQKFEMAVQELFELREAVSVADGEGHHDEARHKLQDGLVKTFFGSWAPTVF